MSKILIVEDDPIIAEDLRLIIEDEGYTVVGVANTGDLALDMIANRHPSLILLDISLNSHMSGLDVAAIINDKYHIPFIFITSFSDNYTLERVQSVFPEGYIMKPFKKRDIIANVNIIMHRQSEAPKGKYLSIEEVNEQLNTAITPKEYDILVHLTEGRNNKKISEIEEISLNTVKTHLKRLFVKLEVDSRLKAASKIIR